MNDQTEIEMPDLIFPDTLEDTKASISALIGEITELRSWVQLQYNGRKNGLRVDWDEVREANEEIARLQGDINALKKHAAGQREVLALDHEKVRAERAKAKLEMATIQKERERQAQEAKKDRRVASAELQARKETAATNAVKRYIEANAPEHLAAVRAVVDAARNATT